MPTRKRIRSTDDPVARDLQDQLDLVPLVSFVTVQYLAKADTTEVIEVPWGEQYGTIVGARPPQAALVVRVQPDQDRSGNPGNLRPAYNFRLRERQGRIEAVQVFEPEGLTADTLYNITVMMLG